MKAWLIELWGSWYFHDALVAGLLAGAAWLVFRLWRHDYWRLAFRQVFQRRLVTAAFVLLCLYTLVALLDSVGYHPRLRDEQGAVRMNPVTHRPLTDPDGVSLLDLILTPLRKGTEKTYSAPLATHLFTKETIVNDQGEVVRDHRPLAHPGIHLLGTDKVGNDVLYQALKSIRTGMILGLVTILLAVPLAILFGVMAGYFGGWVDDSIQFAYSVLASIPGILLIVAFMVIFGQGLPQLCIVLGIAGWTGLCRVLRGETLKLREMEYIQAAEATGVSRPRIMTRHIVPNLMHIVLITGVLGFSGRVISETALTYIGIGVGPGVISWGVMINDALGELARDPIVWWKLFAAFIFMLGLVLPANLFGDAVRDALDPRLRTR